MIDYFSTFITGLQEVIEVALKRDLRDVRIRQLLDGLVVYQTNESPRKIKQLRYFNNSFVLLRLHEKEMAIQSLLKKSLSEPEMFARLPLGILDKASSFRVVVSKRNRLTSVNKELLSSVEDFLSSKLRLRVDRASPDTEVWFLTRSEGISLVGLRITKKPNYEKTLHQGELRPELAHIMCLLAEIKPTDTVLDPFAGYGSIPLECAKHFSLRRIYAGEKDQRIFKLLREKTKVFKSKIVVGKWDALNLSFLADNSIDKIVTDPPWGLYTNIDIESFYLSMLAEFIRLLKPGGLLVVLTAQKEIFEKLVDSFSQLEIKAKYDILVSGKKAAIYQAKNKD